MQPTLWEQKSDASPREEGLGTNYLEAASYNYLFIQSFIYVSM